MKPTVTFLVLLAWLLGALLSGVTIQPAYPESSSEEALVVETEWGNLRLGENRGILTMKGFEDRRQRLRIPVPPILTRWLQDVKETRTLSDQPIPPTVSVPS